MIADIDGSTGKMYVYYIYTVKYHRQGFISLSNTLIMYASIIRSELIVVAEYRTNEYKLHEMIYLYMLI